MFRKVVFALLFLLLASICFLLFRPYTSNKESTRIYFRETASLDEVTASLAEKQILENGFWLAAYARILGIRGVAAGSYVIEPGENLYQLGRRFLLGRQTPVKLILGNERERLRTPQQLSSKIQRYVFTRADSSEWIRFLRSNDSLRSLGVDSFTVMTRLLPLTYEIYWTESPRKIYLIFQKAWDRFWNEDRRKNASRIGLSPTEVMILASIVEEESQYEPDRPLIASTYLNRLRIGMRLQADPTAKFAAGDFNAKQVTYAHLRFPSPYNTYLVAGLPPGSICLPSIRSIDAVLNAPKTEYLYFVASDRFDGTSVFTKDYTEHLKNAKRYQDELRKRLHKKPISAR